MLSRIDLEMSNKEAKESVLAYLAGQNRPYSTNDVVANLHNAHGKAAVQKALDQLTLDGKVSEKLNGKQKAYVVSQANLPAADDAELAAMEADIKAKEEEAARLEAKASKVEGHAKGLESLATTKQLVADIKGLKGEIRTLENKVATLQSSGNVVDKRDMERASAARNEAVGAWRKRRKMCLAVTDAILEGYPKSKKALFEDVGIETEEDLQIRLLEK